MHDINTSLFTEDETRHYAALFDAALKDLSQLIDSQEDCISEDDWIFA